MSGLRERVQSARQQQTAAAAGGGDQAPTPDGEQQLAKRSRADASQYKAIVGELRRIESLLAKALPDGGPSAEQMIGDTMTALSVVDRLDECDPFTVLGAVMTCAQLGLRVGGALGQSYVLPFWNAKRGRYEATFVLGYKGLVKLAHQSGRVRGVAARTVFARELPSFDLTYREDRDALVHRPYLLGPPGEPVLYYARALLLDGGYQLSRPMNREEMRKHRAKHVKIKSGPWFDDRGVAGDGFEAMSHKTCVKLLGRMLPLSVECVWAMAVDGGVRSDTSPDAQLDDVTEHAGGGEGEPIDVEAGTMHESATDAAGWPAGAAPARSTDEGKGRPS